MHERTAKKTETTLDGLDKTPTPPILRDDLQKGFFDHLLRDGESYAEKWAYVEQNPVRAGLVKTVLEWPYAGETQPLPW